MRIKASAATVELVWDLACRPSAPIPNMEKIAKRAESIAAAGYAAKYQVEDLYFDLGMPSECFEDWPARLGFPWETIYHRPRGKADTTLGGYHISAVNLAVSLMRAERLGLSIDPLPLVRAIRPALLKKPLLNEHEMGVLWFARERHRHAPVTLSVKGVQPIWRWGDKPHRLATGYKAFPTFEGDKITALDVVAPRYRASKVGALH